LIGKGEEKILLDTGEDITAEKYVEFLFNIVFPATATKSLSTILLSHGHGDHQGGVLKIFAECNKRGLPLPKVETHTLLLIVFDLFPSFFCLFSSVFSLISATFSILYRSTNGMFREATFRAEASTRSISQTVKYLLLLA
jgi:ribonuclease BN (tRNA processing enzyme)